MQCNFENSFLRPRKCRHVLERWELVVVVIKEKKGGGEGRGIDGIADIGADTVRGLKIGIG